MDRTQTKIPENTGKLQGSTRYKKGQSGNPAGRPPGSRNKATLASEALLEGEAENIIYKLIEKAKDGDITAIKLCVDRFYPVRKDRLINLILPELKSPKDCARAIALICKAVSSGLITPREGEILSNIVEAANKCFELQNMDEKLSIMEAQLEAQNDYEMMP